MTLLDRILLALGLKHTVDVAVVLDDLNVRHGTKLDWRHSVVDLMTLLGVNPSFDNRVALAAELGYEGPRQDTARMNDWLRREIMSRVALNGGVVPEELKEA